MTKRIIIPILVAALTIAMAAPVLAKKQTSEQVYAAEQQAKKKKAKSGENCFLKAPPYMYNPRFMNRGFFKKVCPGQDEQ